MAKTYFEASAINHDFTEYSKENLLHELEERRARGEDAERITKMEGFLNKYPEEFGVLYRVFKDGVENIDEGKRVRFEFKDIPYERPEIEPEEYDAEGKTSQLELVCTFEDGTKFGLSALKAAPQTADEPLQMTGRIHFDEETLKNLNEEKLSRIFAFCDRYGFSSFGLSLPMKDGEIDVETKLAELFAKYQENQEKIRGRSTPREDGDYVHLDTSATSALEAEATHEEASIESESETPETSSEEMPEMPVFGEGIRDGLSAKKINLTLDDVADNLENLMHKDLHKRRGLSYWKDARIIDGRKTYVFTIYDKEDPKNREKDGKKKDDQYVETFSARLYASQDKNGKFHFGYATPNAKAFDSTLAKQFMGEIKKTGATHVNLQNVPACDQDTIMFAAASRGMVPTGVNITSAKAKQLLGQIDKLTAEEQAVFKRRLADQMLENARKNNKDAEPPQYGLPDSEFDFIQDLKEKSQDEASNIAALPIKRKFKNFKDAVEDRGPSGLYTKMKKTAEQGKADREKGAATICGAAHAFNAVFDLYFKHFDETLGQRIAPMLENGEITKEEFIKLAPLSSKVLGQMNSQDFALIYDVLLPRKIKQTEEDILEAYKLRYAENSTDTRPPANILQQDIFPKAKDALAEVNRRLKSESIPELYIPFENKVMSYAVPEYLRPKKKKEETSKPAVSKPDTTREGR